MSLDRRSFLKAGAGLAAAAGTSCLLFAAENPLAQSYFTDQAAEELEGWIATSNGVRLAGRPRSLAAVRQGFWPIPPERVLILHPRPARSPERGLDALRASHLRFDLHTGLTGCSQDRRARDAAHELSSQKLMLIGRITSALADHYGVPGLWEAWGHGMALRELLGSTYVGGNVAQPDYFQKDLPGGKSIRTDNQDIDHWLILIPDGTRDWDGFADLPVHVIITHIFANRERTNSWTCPACVLSGRAVFSLTETEPWHHWALESSPGVIGLSRMDRLSAARLINERFIAAVREHDEWLKQRS